MLLGTPIIHKYFCIWNGIYKCQVFQWEHFSHIIYRESIWSQVTLVASHQIQRGDSIFISVHLHMQIQRDTLQAQHRNLLVSYCSSQSGKLPRHLRKSQCHMGQFNHEIWVCKHTTDLPPSSSFHIVPDPAPHPPKNSCCWEARWPEGVTNQAVIARFICIHTHTHTLSPPLPGVDRTWQSVRLKH